MVSSGSSRKSSPYRHVHDDEEWMFESPCLPAIELVRMNRKIGQPINAPLNELRLPIHRVDVKVVIKWGIVFVDAMKSVAARITRAMNCALRLIGFLAAIFKNIYFRRLAIPPWECLYPASKKRATDLCPMAFESASIRP